MSRAMSEHRLAAQTAVTLSLPIAASSLDHRGLGQPRSAQTPVSTRSLRKIRRLPDRRIPRRAPRCEAIWSGLNRIRHGRLGMRCRLSPTADAPSHTSGAAMGPRADIGTTR
jgi:hypothetical protein